jgi:hypothetical protein
LERDEENTDGAFSSIVGIVSGTLQFVNVTPALAARVF